MDELSRLADGDRLAPLAVPASTAGYAQEAERLAHRYESVAFETVHAAILPLLPPVPSRVLDIGAGTGRDAAALAGRGYHVTAVEPVTELRQVAQRLHADSVVCWVDDALPGLATLSGEFDLVLLSAVWMHLDAPERRDGMRSIHRLLAPGGLAVLTLRHGPVPPGRRMFAISVAETMALAGQFGLCGDLLGSVGNDLLGRGDVHWSTIALRKNRPALVGGTP